MISDTVQDVNQVLHNVGMAAWVGGTMFGRFAHNPSLTRIASHAERGAVANAAWNGYNVVNALGLGAAAAGWTASRFTETQPENLSGAEKGLSLAKDVLMGGAVLTGLLNGVQGARLAKQAPEGAVPIETGTKPAPETPAKAVKIQRSLEVLGNVNIASGIGLVAVNAILAQTNYSRPAKKRALTRSSSPGTSRSPLWIGSAVATAGALVDEARRRLT